MKILILKPSSLGDVVQALPVLRLLKLHFPDSEIHWWIEVRSALLLEGDPDLAGIFRFDRKRWARPWHWGELASSIREIRRHRFDLVIDLQSLIRSGAVAWLANGAFTVGLHDWRELTPGFYDVSVSRPNPETHAVDWYLEALRALGVPVHLNFEWMPERPAVAAEVEELWSLQGHPWIALLPGARWDNKRWPLEHFQNLIRTLRRQHEGLRFVILGSGADHPLGAAISTVAPEACLDLTGRTTLLQLIEVLRVCRGVVTNDTGPMHVAAALGVPTVGIFGPTEPRRTGPYGQLENILRAPLPCAPCFKEIGRAHV